MILEGPQIKPNCSRSNLCNIFSNFPLKPLLKYIPSIIGDETHHLSERTIIEPRPDNEKGT